MRNVFYLGHNNTCARTFMYDIFHLRESNVCQKIAQLIFSIHKDILFCQVVIPYKGQFKDLEYTIKCDILQLEKKKNKQTKSICCDC